MLHYLTDDHTWFPPAETALEEPEGLLAIGGDLSPKRIYHAYQQGIFPWFNEGEPIMWWSPDPRAVMKKGDIRINKSLKKFLKKCDYEVSLNMAFRQVMEHCAGPRRNAEGTWILPEMINSYEQLHKDGKAHSIEIWQTQGEVKTLIGGLYGLNVGKCFCGESMFSLQPNASKLALICLNHLIIDTYNGFIDCQLPNPYLMSMGATLISKAIYLEKLALAQKIEQVDNFLPKAIEWKTIIESYEHG